MLRLPPSEITLSPDDIRGVSDRIDNRKRARGKVRLHRGPERSRDEAVTTLSKTYWAPSQAEHSSDEYFDAECSRPLKIRIRSGPSTPTGAQVHRGVLPTIVARQAPPPPIGLRGGDLVPGRVHRIPTTADYPQLHFDGQTDFPLNHSPANPTFRSHRTREISLSTRLLQAHTASTPSFPSTIMMYSPARRPHTHSRQPLSEGAAAMSETNDHPSGDRTTGFHPNSNSSDITPNANSRTDTRQPSAGTIHQLNVMSVRVSSSSNTISTSLQDASRRSSSSDAAEAAAADLPSPLDNLSQRAALANTRLASQTRTVPSFAEPQILETTVMPRRMVDTILRMQEMERRNFLTNNPSYLVDFPSYRAILSRPPVSSSTTSAPNRTITPPARVATISEAVGANTYTIDYSTESLPPPPQRSQAQTIRRRPVASAVEGRAPYEDGIVIPERSSSRLQTPAASEAASIMIPRTRPSESAETLRRARTLARELHRSTRSTHVIHTASSQDGDINANTTSQSTDRRNGIDFQREGAGEGPDPARTPPGRAEVREETGTRGSFSRSRNAGWQRNQENSEELAMSTLVEEMGGVSLVVGREEEMQNGVMDNTPPRQTRVDRILNGN